MRRRSRSRTLTLLVLPLLVFGCSRGFDVFARAEHGALVFHAMGAGWFDFGEADEKVCTFSVLDSVRLRAAEAAETESSRRLLWQQPATMWSFEEPMQQSGRNCPEMPIVYGRTPPGLIERVPARRLVRGRLYEIYATAPGAAGGGYFRIVAR